MANTTSPKITFQKAQTPEEYAQYDYMVFADGEYLGEVGKWHIGNYPYARWYNYWAATHNGQALKGGGSRNSTREEAVESLLRAKEAGFPPSQHPVHDFPYYRGLPSRGKGPTTTDIIELMHRGK